VVVKIEEVWASISLENNSSEITGESQQLNADVVKE
jgi:hypothetical protein